MIEQFSTSLNILTAAATLAYIVRLLSVLHSERALTSQSSDMAFVPQSIFSLKRSLLNQTIARRLTSATRCRARQ